MRMGAPYVPNRGEGRVEILKWSWNGQIVFNEKEESALSVEVIKIDVESLGEKVLTTNQVVNYPNFIFSL